MAPHPDAPGGATHYFANLPDCAAGRGEAGELEHASGFGVGREGLLRAFVGTVERRPGTYENSFIIDIPADVDITTADSELPQIPGRRRARGSGG